MLREIASVLFVGHSLISPTLPTMMDDLLEAEVHYQIINGAPLESAWKDSRKAEGEDGRALLRKAPVDVLVLTERVLLDPTLRWHDPAERVLVNASALSFRDYIVDYIRWRPYFT